MSDHNDPDQLKKFSDMLNKIGAAICHKNGCVAVMNARIVREVYKNTYLSLKRYTHYGTIPNHFKEAGHAAHWISRLKPFRIFYRENIELILKQLGIPFEATQLESVPGSGDIHFLNEVVALMTGQKIVDAVEAEALQQLINQGRISAEEAEVHIRHIQDRRKRVAGVIGRDIVTLLRYGTPSPMSTAVLMEALLRCDCAFINGIDHDTFTMTPSQ